MLPVSQQTPSRKSIYVILAIGLVLVALFSLVVGNASMSEAIVRLILYGGAFLILTFILDRARRGRP